MLVISLNYVYLFQPPFSDTTFMHLCLCLFIIYHNNTHFLLLLLIFIYFYKKSVGRYSKNESENKKATTGFHLVCFIFRSFFPSSSIYRQFLLRCLCWHWHLFRLIDGMQYASHFSMYQQMDVHGAQLDWYGLERSSQVFIYNIKILNIFIFWKEIYILVL